MKIINCVDEDGYSETSYSSISDEIHSLLKDRIRIILNRKLDDSDLKKYQRH